MKAIAVIESQVEDNAITLNGKFETKLTFLGSSCPASVKPGDRVSSFSVSTGTGDEIVAVKTAHWQQRGKSGNWDENHFLLQFSPMWIELDKAFVPRPDRLGQIVPDIGLSVRIGDEFFLSPLLVSDYHREERLAKLRERYRMVSVADANLLCRFIASKATAEEVKAAAAELAVQTVDVPALRKKLEEAEQRMKELKEENLLLSAENRLLDERICETQRQLSDDSYLTSWISPVVGKLRFKRQKH